MPKLSKAAQQRRKEREENHARVGQGMMPALTEEQHAVAEAQWLLDHPDEE